jgi:hypothetical protein
MSSTGPSISLSAFLFRPLFAVGLVIAPAQSLRPAGAQESSFPQIIHVRYEAKDAKTGGNFMI